MPHEPPTVQEIIDDLNEMTTAQIGDWDTASTHGSVTTAGNGNGNLVFSVEVIAAGFDNEDDTSRQNICSQVTTHIISSNGDPRQ